MGSDASEESLDAFMPPLPAPRMAAFSLPSSQVGVSSAERDARDKVQDCLEKGQETVDISYVLAVADLGVTQELMSHTTEVYVSNSFQTQLSHR
jgi:hypothetical protein